MKSKNKNHIDTDESLDAALGVTLLDDSVVEKYSQLRRAGSENMLSILALQDREYEKRQGERNDSYVRSIMSVVPSAELLTHNIKRRKSELSLSTKTTIKDHEIRFRSSSSEALEEIGSETIDAPSVFRAVSIWIPRKTDEILHEKNSAGFFGDDKVTHKDDEIEVPHVIIGHRVVGNGKYMRIMLHPANVSNLHSFRGWNRDKLKDNNVKFKPPRPIIATMTSESYSRLIAIQDALIGEGLTAAEIDSIHDPADSSLIVSPSKLPCVKAELRRSTLGLAIQRSPKAHKDLDEDFDLKLEEVIAPQKIGPELFSSFHILEDTQRLMAMLGQIDKFNEAKDRLKKSSLTDPVISLLNS